MGRFDVETNGVAKKEAIYVSENIRITVLFDRLIRIEKQKDGKFTDEATQGVLFRNFSVPEFSVKEDENEIVIKTKKIELTVMKEQLKNSTVKFCNDGKVSNIFGKDNLKGTLRTLDTDTKDKGLVIFPGEAVETYQSVDRIPNGLIAKSGVAVYDDSLSLILDKTGVLERAECEDLYVFAYGRDYRSAIKDYYKISGFTPLVPRFAFGNWWSRYHAYTQDEYVALMQKFEEKEIPLSVATIDMDWHYVYVEKEFYEKLGYTGKELEDKIKEWKGGWTGYTWDKKLFPDYKAFLKTVNDMGLKITLNLHPADGVRWFEDCYEEFAKRMGIDPKTKQTVNFDITDDKFIENYFELLHHGYEDDGVAFWWIDWQQGFQTKKTGLDPLWMLNHLHYHDNCRGNKAGLINSRYCGAGAHRYPVGFSGDTIIDWESLNYIPYFTSTASNVGYTWWSHDIGGHHGGYKDDELLLRWIEFGVFSPINRLHSTNYKMAGKEPWKYHDYVESVYTRYLRLRHQLVPYLYTYSHLTHTDGRALIEPMYYAYPDDERAYECKNQYLFGSELMVAPITTKSNGDGVASVKAFIPDGVYTDIFTGNIYKGDTVTTLYRETENIPVLAHKGSIVPLSLEKGNGAKNPKDLEVLVFNGNGQFTMIEDDGKDTLETTFSVNVMDDTLIFAITLEGNKDVAPQDRNYKINFKNVYVGKVLSLEVDGKKTDGKVTICDNLKVSFTGKKAVIKVKMIKSIENYLTDPMSYIKDKARAIVDKINGDNYYREDIFNAILTCKDYKEYQAVIDGKDIMPRYKNMLKELMF